MSPVDATLPFQLDTPEFKQAWDEYVEYRKQAKLKKLLPMSVQKMWDKMADAGPSVAVEAINETIANGWQGIFLDRVKAQSGIRNASSETRYASLGALRMEMDRVNAQLENLINPGGSAWGRRFDQLNPDEQARYKDLRLQREGLQAKIAAFSKSA